MSMEAIFQRALLTWFSSHRRSLPWRRKRDQSDPYRILVSEVMLQQTQVPRVVVVYERFLKQFPTLESLAAASNRDVLIAWRGMGYNRRALMLRDAARYITEHMKMRNAKAERRMFPREMDALQKIPGIGPYTAAAIRNFAWNLPTPCADTNIKRILHRVFVGPEVPSWRLSEKQILKLAEMCLFEGIRRNRRSRRHSNVARKRERNEERGTTDRVTWPSARAWHSALMDFGAAVCTKRAPRCEACPLNKICKSAFVIQRRLNVERANEERGTSRREPGRTECGTFIPNRIYRGRAVELLRSSPRGLTLETIGRQIKWDWRRRDLQWLRHILQTLVHDRLIAKHLKRYSLSP